MEKSTVSVEWQVSEDGKVRRLDEAKLRKKLRAKDLTGLELARRTEDEAWVPLHSLPIFAQEVPHTDAPGRVAASRLVQSFFGHALSWGIVAMTVGSEGGSLHTWTLIWGAFVALHAGKTGLQLWRSRAQLAPPTAAPSPAPPQAAPSPVAAAQPASKHDPFLAQLDAALEALGTASRAQDADLDLAGVRAGAIALHAQTQALAAVCAPELRSRLDAQCAEARARLDTAPDPVAQETFGAELAAIQARQASMARAQATAQRLAARERTLLHQLEDLRLSVLQTGLDAAARTPVAHQARALAEQLEADAEVEATLAQARLRQNQG